MSRPTHLLGLGKAARSRPARRRSCSATAFFEWQRRRCGSRSGDIWASRLLMQDKMIRAQTRSPTLLPLLPRLTLVHCSLCCCSCARTGRGGPFSLCHRTVPCSRCWCCPCCAARPVTAARGATARHAAVGPDGRRPTLARAVLAHPVCCPCGWDRRPAACVCGGPVGPAMPRAVGERRRLSAAGRSGRHVACRVWAAVSMYMSADSRRPAARRTPARAACGRPIYLRMFYQIRSRVNTSTVSNFYTGLK